jgi:hypothetical protein
MFGSLYVLALLTFINITSYESYSFHGDRNQWNFLKPTASSGYEGFCMFWELIISPSSGCAGDVVGF